MTIRIGLPYVEVPLSANHRFGRRKTARITAQIRRDVSWLARSAKVPRNCAHAVVGLHYAPAENRRRDADNLFPTLKAACDGLVDAGIVPDDTPRWMTKRMPVIEPISTTGTGQLWIELTLEETT